MFPLRLRTLFLISQLLAKQCATQNPSSPFMIPSSSTTYGPDGPWQAVKVWIGTPGQSIDLYPGGTYASTLMSKHSCVYAESLPCGSGGLYDQSASVSADSNAVGEVAPLDWNLQASNLQSDPQRSWYAMDTISFQGPNQEDLTVQNLSIIIVDQVYLVYPDNPKHYAVQVGSLALGGSTCNQTLYRHEVPVYASLVPCSLWKKGLIPSNSYGLHIGSASLNIPLSLWLGGYDSSRVIGPVSSQPARNPENEDNLFIDLLDIGIGVDHGASPFSYTSRAGFLLDNSPSAGSSFPIAMNPQAPYLYLPNSTCNAIAQDLPVTYHANYGLYFWNTADPRYSQIISSPSYLSFTFRGNASTGTSSSNLTINVPFSLLNLTLGPPLIDTPVQYFPCTPPKSLSTYSLGRAFLQAAFTGVEWSRDNGTWHLAQAPGPNIPSAASSVTFGDSIRSSSANWASTWEGHWTPLSATPNPQAVNGDQAPQGGGSGVHLSGGAISGIAIGALAFVAIAFAAFLLIRLRRHRGRASYQEDVKPWKPEPVLGSVVVHEAPDMEPHEVVARQGMVWEMSAERQHEELDAR